MISSPTVPPLNIQNWDEYRSEESTPKRDSVLDATARAIPRSSHPPIPHAGKYPHQLNPHMREAGISAAMPNAAKAKA